jgi:hypothetical protein
MLTTGSLWLPAIIATVLCFLGGSVLHMMLPLHRKDFGGLPEEDAVLDALRKSGAGPGNYLFPYCTDMKAFKEPAFVAKLESGPCGIMTLRKPGKMVMGPYFTKQILFHLLVSFSLAYLSVLALNAGMEYMRVFRFVGTAAFLTYTAAIFPAAIWFHEPRNVVVGKVIDGAVWGLLTAGSFAGFWPA